MQKYFAPIINDKVILNDGDIHHLLHVMRAKNNDVIEVSYENKSYRCVIKSINPLNIEVEEEISLKRELDIKITLFFALAKGDKIDLVIQKATELGVSRIVLVRTKRDVVKLSDDDFERKSIRYNLIAKEASEQCHRNYIPEILGVYDIDKIPSFLLADVNYVAYEELNQDKPNFNNINVSSLSVLIGSEGGLTNEEILKLKSQGFIPVSLGKRILRTETAAIYCLSVLSYLIESK